MCIVRRASGPVMFMSRTLAVIAASMSMAGFADDRAPNSLSSNQKPASSTDPVEAIEEAGQRAISAIEERESVRMLKAVALGEDMGPESGWFHASESRFDWKWLAERHGASGDGVITVEKFQGAPEAFKQLDRNRDGALKQEDFDWSDDSEYAKQLSQAMQWYRGIDTSSNRRITRAEWDQYFEKLLDGKDYVTPEDLRAKLFPPSSGSSAGQEPSKLMLLKGLLTGEIGSFMEGPALNAEAPDFELQTQDGKQSIRLASFREQKPVVLIFGSFT
jgi:hypothetical protein